MKKANLTEFMDRYILSHLDEAVAEGWLYVVYQPIVRTVSMKACAAEALVRWKDPLYGDLSPADFIPVLEENHRMFELDLYVFELVMRDYSSLMRKGVPMVPVSLNLSRSDFLDVDILPLMDKLVLEYGVPKKYIRLEIAEEVFQAGAKDIQQIVDRMTESGYTIWMDNFGGGYSSLGALMDSNFSLLKYDMRFLRGRDLMKKDRKLKAAISYVVNMSKDLGMGTLAQGVETEEEFRYLRDSGCSMVQGYFVSRPLTFSEFQGMEMQLEDDADWHYYQEIGAVKIEDNEGLGQRRTAKHVDPMAVLEYKNHRFNLIYQNDVHVEYMETLGIHSVTEEESFLNQPVGMMQEKIRRFTAHILRGEQQVHLNFVLKGQIVDIWANFIARNERDGAVAFSLHGTTLTDDGRDRTQDFEFMMEKGVYQLFDKLDLVRHSDGIVINSFLNTADFGGIYEGQYAQTALRNFGENYIAEKDRARFLEMGDVTKLQKHLRAANSNYITDVYETLMENGERVLKRYVLMELKQNDEELYLAAILNTPVCLNTEEK